MKRILYSLLVATLPFGSVLADMRKEKNAKVTLVYQHELPNVPGKSIKGGAGRLRVPPLIASCSPRRVWSPEPSVHADSPAYRGRGRMRTRAGSTTSRLPV